MRRHPILLRQRSGPSGLLALGLLLWAAPGVAQQRPFTVQDALAVRSVRVADVTEDGRWIAATARTHRDRLGIDHHRFGDPTYVAASTEEILVVDAESGDVRSVFDDQVQVASPVWSPTDDRLAFLLLEGQRYRLAVYDVVADRVRTVELRTDKAVADVMGVSWRPDGSGVILALRAEGWRENARQAYLELSEGPVVVQDSRNDFLAWDRVRNLGSLAVPALVELPSGEVRELLPEGRYPDAEQSEDGRFVSFVTATPLKTTYDRRDGTEYALLRLDLETGDTLTVVEPSTDRLRPRWSPGGDAFAYTEEGDVLVRSLTADSARNLTSGRRGPVSEDDTATIRYGIERWRPDGGALLLDSQRGWHLLDLESGEVELVFELEDDETNRPRREVEAWSADGREVYVATSERDRWERGLARLNLEAGEMEQLVADANLYRGWRLAEDGSRLLFRMSDGDHPADLYVADPAYRSTRRLTDLNPWLAERTLTRSELVDYLDADGNRLYGVLYYPVDYEPGKRYPLVAEIYEDFFDNGFNHRMNLLANQGWFAFRPSVEFEEGYPGEAWLKGVTAGINELIDRGLVDGERLGVHGTSYGGYATNLLITQTDRFAAAINISGKVDIISFLGDSPKITVRNYYAAESGQDRIGATLWEQPLKYVAHSAVMFADRIDTPLLMLSGEGDWNVPATNQREMYYALRRLGKDVVWVHYMNAGHGAGRAGTVSDFHDHWNRILDWYRDHFEAVGETGESHAEEGGGS